MSNNEYEQQQFWEDKPIEVILNDTSGWESDWKLNDRHIVWLHEEDLLTNPEYIKQLNNGK